MNEITVPVNHWGVPSVQRVYANILEGCPTEAERQEIIATTEAARAVWVPTAEAFALVDQLRAWVGLQLVVQCWDSCMFMFANEGPFPFSCSLDAVELCQVDGFLQAYLRVTNIAELKNADGYSPVGYIENVDGMLLVSLAHLYQVKLL
jgi:hypothetical protein